MRCGLLFIWVNGTNNADGSSRQKLLSGLLIESRSSSRLQIPTSQNILAAGLAFSLPFETSTIKTASEVFSAVTQLHCCECSPMLASNSWPTNSFGLPSYHLKRKKPPFVDLYLDPWPASHPSFLPIRWRLYVFVLHLRPKKSPDLPSLEYVDGYTRSNRGHPFQTSWSKLRLVPDSSTSTVVSHRLYWGCCLTPACRS